MNLSINYPSLGELTMKSIKYLHVKGKRANTLKKAFSKRPKVEERKPDCKRIKHSYVKGKRSNTLAFSKRSILKERKPDRKKLIAKINMKNQMEKKMKKLVNQRGKGLFSILVPLLATVISTAVASA